MSWLEAVYPQRRQARLLDPRTKIFVLLSVSVVVVCLDQPISLLALTAFASCVALAIRPSRAFWMTWIPISAIGIWGMVASQALFYSEYPRTAVWVLVSPETPVVGALTGGVAVYREGLAHGLVQSLRFVVMLTLGLLVGFTTERRDLLAGLLWCRIPSAMAFMVTAALRFIPTVISEARQVLETQRLRGANLLSWSPWKTLRGLLNFLKPILIRNIRRARLVADAAETRGFTPDMDPKRWQASSIRPLRLHRGELLLFFAVACVTLGVLGAKLSHWIYVHRLAQSDWLRYVSGFASHYL